MPQIVPDSLNISKAWKGYRKDKSAEHGSYIDLAKLQWKQKHGKDFDMKTDDVRDLVKMAKANKKTIRG